jgi:DNA polymerase I
MLLGIDATNWVHVLWRAPRGRDVTAAILRRLQALVDVLGPRATVACFDRRSTRAAIDSGYKASRKEKPAELVAELAAVELAVAESELATIAAEDGAEADDSLATLAAFGRLSGEEVILASPDKDLRQCLIGPVKLLRSFRCSWSEANRRYEPCEGDWYTAMRLFDETGLQADQWVDYQMLCGDAGDDIHGPKGWGDKTATACLIKVGSVERMLANPWLCPCSDRQRGTLIDFKRRAGMVRQLVTLRVDVAAVWDALR